jgi:4-hydroxy-3-polyprenylbenzoate decarboxylase
MNDLPSFIKELEKRGELKRISHPVSCNLEITDIADRMVKTGGPALLFENVPETPGTPVAIGLYGSDSRVALALHDAPQDIANRIEGLIKTVPPESLIGKMQLGLKLLPTGMSLGVKSVKTGRSKSASSLGEDVTCPSCGLDVLAAGRRAVRDAADGLHAQPQHGAPQRRDVSRANLRQEHRGMHWQMQQSRAQHHREATQKSQPIDGRRPARAAIRVCRFALWRRCPRKSTR